MKITFRTFLLASVALGCLQTGGFAMDEPPQKAIHQKKNSSDSDSEDVQRERILSHLMDVEHKNQRQVYEEGAQKGDKDACYHLANYYYFGRQFLEKPEDIKNSYYRQGKERIYYQIGFLKVAAEDYEKAFDLYKKSGDQGHAAALWSLGECYELQRGVKENLDLATFYYMASAKLNYPPAKRSLGLLHLDGLGGLEKSDSEAVKLFRQAADKGLPSAQVNLGMMYFLGRGIPQSDYKALNWFYEAAGQGFANAQVKVGEMHRNGQGVKRNIPKAIKWFQKAADQGYEPAKKSLGELPKRNPAPQRIILPQEANNSQFLQFLEEPKPRKVQTVPHKAIPEQKSVGMLLGRAQLAMNVENYKEALECFRKAAELDNASAFNSLGLMHEDGLGVEKSETKAAKYYHKAAERDHAKAQANLGRMYREGFGVPQSDVEAVKWYKLSAAQDFAPGQSNLGTMYVLGRGVPQDMDKAAKYLRRAADQGYGPAQLALSELYRTGNGVMPNKAKSVKLRNKAESQGIDFTTQGYPRTYLTPGVVQRDLEEVRIAAEQGNIATHFNMGMIYIDGLQGVKQDYTEALKWFHKAAEKGDIASTFCIGMMHMNGQGVEKNEAEAQKWLKKAAAKGDINAQSIVENRAKRNVSSALAPISAEKVEQWQPSDGESIQVGNLVMALKKESGKSPNAPEMLAYIENKVNLSSVQIKFILEDLGLAIFKE